MGRIFIVDDYAIGIYKQIYDDEQLVGHVWIEFSKLFYQCLERIEDDTVTVTVRGSRKLENGLVVPVTYNVIAKNKKFVDISKEQMKKRMSGNASHMDVKISTIKCVIYLFK